MSEKRRKKYEACLKEHFGLKKLKDEQFEVIDNIIHNKKDVCCVLATGFGKSLCYQFPAVYLNKPVIVISPLISLMEDQKSNLEKVGIKACCYNSTMENSQKCRNDILANKYHVVYMTPEYIAKSEKFLKRLDKDVGIALFACDEAHSISLWGCSFRPSYRELNCLKNCMSHIPVLATTATATTRTQQDICDNLELVDPIIVNSSIDRPNLYFTAKPKTKIANDADEIASDTLTLVYCQTRKMTEKMAELLKAKGVKCEAYHAGMTNKKRYKIHHKFLDEEITCVVCTNSFGMGIDKPNIRRVIHYGVSQNIECYYQEVGRCGRDGLPSTCCVYYGDADFVTNRVLLKELKDPKYKKHQMKLLQLMEQYVYSKNCRRQILLDYFGDTTKNENEKCCDNCTHKEHHKDEENNQDVTKEATKLIKLVRSVNFGVNTLVDILCGVKGKKTSYYASSSKYFGKGTEHNALWWKNLIQIMMREGYFQRRNVRGSFGCTVAISDKSTKWMKDEEATMTFDLPKVKKADVIKVTKEQNKRNSAGNKITWENSYKLFTEGKSLDKIAKKTGLVIQTIENHIVKAIENKKEIDFSKLDLTLDNYKKIVKVIKSEEINNDVSKLSPIKEMCPKGISYGQIRLAIAVKKMKLKDQLPNGEGDDDNE
jgi:Werner syndrome ATP-dependent helicase